MSVAIRIPAREDQTEFNLRVWEMVLADPSLAGLEQRFETDRHGHLIMTLPPGPAHGTRQFEIGRLLHHYHGGKVVTECPVNTPDGVKAVDVGWFSMERFKEAFDSRCFLQAPEICVDVISPSNTRAEMTEKIALYFEAGAEECWFCEEDGRMRFFAAPTIELAASAACPGFPAMIPI